MYKIVRYFSRDDVRPRTIKTGLTLEEAQAHRRDKETSSRTATSAKAKRYTAIHGPWYDVTLEEAHIRKPKRGTP